MEMINWEIHLQGRLEPTKVEAFAGFHTEGWLTALPANMIPGWK